MNFGDFGIFEDFWENFEGNSEEFYGEWYRDFEGAALIMDDIDFNAPVIDRKLGNICSSSFRWSEFWTGLRRFSSKIDILTTELRSEMLIFHFGVT